MSLSSFAVSTRRPLAALCLFALAACGGGGGGGAGPAPAPPPVDGPPPELVQRIDQAAAEIRADTCFQRADTSGCAWADHRVDAADFAMPRSTGGAVLVIDEFHHQPPLLAVRYGNRLQGHYELGAGGTLAAAPGALRLPATLRAVLRRFAAPEHIPARYLAALLPAIEAAYGGVDLGSPGHGAFVLSLLIDANPHQPFVLLQALDLATMDHADYCDTSGAADVQARLLAAAGQGALQLQQLMRDHHVRFVNYSAGHTLPVLRDSWANACGTAVPPDTLLRDKLAAYAPLYAALFNTPGVLTSHAAYPATGAADFPYDYPSAAYPNRLRIGFFTALESGLDALGRGPHGALQGSPGFDNVDLYVNTGVMPTRPFPYNATPLLQTDRFGVSVAPITGPQPSWVAPLALSRFVHLRNSTFAARAFDDALIADIFDAARPRECNDLPGGRCVFQDPLLHGQTEAVRLGYQPRLYTP